MKRVASWVWGVVAALMLLVMVALGVATSRKTPSLPIQPTPPDTKREEDKIAELNHELVKKVEDLADVVNQPDADRANDELAALMNSQ